MSFLTSHYLIYHQQDIIITNLARESSAAHLTLLKQSVYIVRYLVGSWS